MISYKIEYKASALKPYQILNTDTADSLRTRR